MLTASTGYELIKNEIGYFLQQHGFQAYKSATFYRITPGDILQFLTFQKGLQSLENQMTINIVIQGLFSSTCSFQTLQPGGRIGQFLTLQKDKWWHCNNEMTTLDSINDIKESLALTVLPALQERATSAEQMINTFNTPMYRFLWQHQNAFIDQGYICLKAQRYYEGLNLFQSGRSAKVSKLKTMQNWIKQEQFDKIDHLLEENVHYQKGKWKI